MLPDDLSYFINEGSLQLPAGFQDRTANIFVQGDTEQSTFNLNIGRDNMHPDETLAAYVERQIGLMKEKISGYKLLSRGNACLGKGDSAIDGEQIDACYRSANRTIYQRQAAFPLSEQRVLIFSATGASPHGEHANAIWTGWLESFTPRGAVAPANSATAPQTPSAHGSPQPAQD